MKRNTIRLVVILATISIVGISIIQVYWFRRAFDLEEQRFDREATAALHDVASRFFEINRAAIPSSNIIRKFSSNYYVVMINNEIDAGLLEYLLKTEFEKRGLRADFEYGIYDCTNDEMVYGSYVSFSNEDITVESDLPKWENQSYYFGVNFPSRTSTLLNRMGIWTFSSIMLVVVILFFGYTLFVIFRQKRLSEIQKDFINNMTHEFKTPISTIAISVEVLKDAEITRHPDRLLNYARIIEGENNRMKKQVERVLQIATSEENIEYREEVIDMGELLEEVVDSLQLTIQERGGKVLIAEDMAGMTVRGDRLHVNNIFYNLIDNALKYGGEQPVVEIAGRTDGKFCRFEVRDSGPGIPQEEHERIFRRFYRIPTGNRHDVKGFGLGLSYVRQAIEAMGGKVSVTSEAHRGTVFTIEMLCA